MARNDDREMTKGFKMPQELKAEVDAYIEASGLSNKDWFEKAFSLMKVNDLKEGSIDYKQDLTELETHTTRIYELVANMVNRSVFLKDAAVREVSEKLNQKEAVLGEYQRKTDDAVKSAETSNELLKAAEAKIEELKKQVSDLQSTNDNNQALIIQYKEKIDTLSGLVTKYQSFAEENQKLKDQFSNEKAELQKKTNTVMAENVSYQENISKLQEQITYLEDKHSYDIERLSSSKDIEKEKAIIEKEREFQTKLSEFSDDYNARLRTQYDDLSSMRKEYEEKIEKLQQQLEEAKNPKSES